MIANIIAVVCIAAAVGLAVRYIVKSRRKAKRTGCHSCCGCSSAAHCCSAENS